MFHGTEQKIDKTVVYSLVAVLYGPPWPHYYSMYVLITDGTEIPKR